jgi:hypothetical protein
MEPELTIEIPVDVAVQKLLELDLWSPPIDFDEDEIEALCGDALEEH